MKLFNTFLLIGNYFLSAGVISAFSTSDFTGQNGGYIVGVLIALVTPIATVIYLHKTRKGLKS